MKNESSLTPSAQKPDNPTYNLKVVVQKTGLKPDTLRAWERRYGLPNPVRTAGGHRLYSHRDIQILKWLINHRDNGLSISHAVNLWNRLKTENKDPLKSIVSTSSQQTPSRPMVSGSNLSEMRKGWINACAKFDERSATNIISQALAMHPVETVCFELFQRGLSEIGMRWYEGSLSVQQEHFASALAVRRLESLISGTPSPTREEGRILIGCAAEDEHIFPPLLLTLLLRRQGWDVVYLGANVPAERLVMTVQAAMPKLIILTAQTLWTASNLAEMAETLVTEDVPLAFGGLIFSSNEPLRKRIHGHFLGATLPQAAENIERLIRETQSYTEVTSISAETQAAYAHFLNRQAKIEALVWETIGTGQIKPGHLSRANRDLSRVIASALKLGDLNFITPEMAWVEGMLMSYHYRMPAEALRAYMLAYQQAAEQALDERGQIILDWLAQTVA